MPRLSQRTKRKDLRDLTILMSWLNWPTFWPRITLYELLRLSKSTREVLREALVDAEVFMAQILVEPREKNEEDCLHASQNAPLHHLHAR